MKNFFKILIFAGFYLIASVSFAQQICPLNTDTPTPRTVESLDEFKKLAILHNGRIKPVDTFARNFLLQLSVEKNLKSKKPPLGWQSFFFRQEKWKLIAFF